MISLFGLRLLTRHACSSAASQTTSNPRQDVRAHHNVVCVCEIVSAMTGIRFSHHLAFSTRGGIYQGMESR